MIALMGYPSATSADVIVVLAGVAIDVCGPGLPFLNPAHGWVPMPDPWGCRAPSRRAQVSPAVAWRRSPRARLPPRRAIGYRR